MKIRPVYNFKYLPSDTGAMVVYPFILLRRDRDFYVKTRRGEIFLRHELQHVYQIEKNHFYWWYVKYFVEWFWLLIKYEDPFTAYLSISYEVEAYEMEDNRLTEQQWNVFRDDKKGD